MGLIIVQEILIDTQDYAKVSGSEVIRQVNTTIAAITVTVPFDSSTPTINRFEVVIRPIVIGVERTSFTSVQPSFVARDDVGEDYGQADSEDYRDTERLALRSKR